MKWYKNKQIISLAQTKFSSLEVLYTHTHTELRILSLFLFSVKPIFPNSNKVSFFWGGGCSLEGDSEKRENS